jgi:DNA-binding transcriptional regulator YiaG
MPNLAGVLKTEISRLARKEVRLEVEALRKLVVGQRAEIAALKRKLSDLERASKAQARAMRTGGAGGPSEQAPAQRRALRFSAAGLASLRQKLGLSAADMALLIGTTGQSVYAWEQQKSVPRPKYLEAISAVRGLGKRAVSTRLAQLRAR